MASNHRDLSMTWAGSELSLCVYTKISMGPIILFNLNPLNFLFFLFFPFSLFFSSLMFHCLEIFYSFQPSFTLILFFTVNLSIPEWQAKVLCAFLQHPKTQISAEPGFEPGLPGGKQEYFLCATQPPCSFS